MSTAIATIQYAGLPVRPPLTLRAGAPQSGDVATLTASDEQLMQLVQQGRQDALANLYDRYVRRVYGMAMQKLNDPAEAQDITQDVFLTVWNRAQTFRAEKGKTESWLLTVAHHKIIDRLREKRLDGRAMETVLRETDHAVSAELANPLDQAVKSDEGARVRKALQSLPEDQRTVLTMAYFQGLSQSEISEKLNLPLGTVKTRVRSGMKQLKVALQSGTTKRYRRCCPPTPSARSSRWSVTPWRSTSMAVTPAAALPLKRWS
jgi:RNA polymerase sigma-70 factor (ECF subfamily)